MREMPGFGPISSSSMAEHDPRLLSPPRRSNASKEKRNPSITPRKFRRFFTPRSLASSQPSTSRKALHDLAAPALNRCQTPSSPLKPIVETLGQEKESSFSDARRSKRRKTQHTPDSSPARHDLIISTVESKPAVTNQSGLLSPIQSLKSSQDILHSDDDESEEETPYVPAPIRRIKPLASRGFEGQLVQRQLGGTPRAGRHFISCPTADWRAETAEFYSRPDDVHTCSSHENPGRCIPFCTAACHTNSIVAVGDEEGRVRLLESSGDSRQPFSKIHLSFQAHSNAVIDLAFSDDDYLLATASGDQTGRVIDMMTQTPVAVLGHHTASVKQVRFQPGKANSSVLATSSRDGSIQIWDLRCKGGPAQDFTAFSLPSERDTSLQYRRSTPKVGCAVNSIWDAHARTSKQTRQSASIGQGDMPSRGEMPGRIGDVSVTALQFLSPGQEHLLISACEADATIKLWDTRILPTSRHRNVSPLSYAAPPASHANYRPFGISSLCLNSDASRLYALCKDNTVYAYSTAHLMLGAAPELSSSSAPRRRHGPTQEGLGPLYGFRHPQFHATTFYVKCAVRPVKDGRGEILAVGSNDGCAVLFPTSERYFRRDISLTEQMQDLSISSDSNIATPTSSLSDRRRLQSTIAEPSRPRQLFRQPSTSNFSARQKDNIPIIHNGTPLVRGHNREVGALAWTNEGNLVTVGDDYLIRRWSEDRAQAADLRTGGETGGRRWGCGWADVGDDWDVDDDGEA